MKVHKGEYRIAAFGNLAIANGWLMGEGDPSDLNPRDWEVITMTIAPDWTVTLLLKRK